MRNNDESAAPDHTTPFIHPAGRAGGEMAAKEHGTLWLKDGIYVKPMRVRIGLTDGTNTEIEGNDLSEGTEVVMGEIDTSAAASGAAKNPFIPQFGNRRRGGAGGGGGRGAAVTTPAAQEKHPLEAPAEKANVLRPSDAASERTGEEADRLPEIPGLRSISDPASAAEKQF